MRVILPPRVAVLALSVLANSAGAQSKDPTKEALKPQPAAEATPLKSRQAKIKGLLVMELAEGKLAGSASQMNATAVAAAGSTTPAELKFNQKVGEQMSGALNEVKKFLSVRHHDWPKGWTIELSFEDHYQMKDGPSGAVACALMVDSLLTGAALDNELAVTGDLNADGAVRPVGGVPDKVRAAGHRKCQLVCIPLKNALSMADHAIVNGPVPLGVVQVFTASEFDDVKRLAVTPRPPDLNKAIAAFAEIQKALPAQPNPRAWLKHPKVVAKLKEVLAAAPNHLSAKIMLAMAEGREAQVLSAGGSIEAIHAEAGGLLAFVRNGSIEKTDRDKLSSAMSRLSAIRPRLDKRTLPYAESIIDYSRSLRFHLEDKKNNMEAVVKARRELDTKGSRLRAEWDSLRSNRELMETVLAE